ncbi:MAG: 50S ribosomal protein L10 [Bacillales bacterium]|jgi:large subunit ribosomal protein L10|nr:50S ribosomal protein L10 [Bacillales bacterium]
MAGEALNQKKEVVSKIKESFQSAKSITVAEYRGLSVAQLEELRKQLRAEDSELAVFKNSLVEKASEDLGISLEGLLTGPNAFVVSRRDAVTGPRILRKFSKTADKLVIKGGLVEGRLLDAGGIKTVATLPPRETLLAMFIGCLQAPISKFAATVKAVADAKGGN